METAKQLRHAPELEQNARIELRRGNPSDDVGVTVSGAAGRDHRVIVRPDRSVVIRHRVVPRFGCRYRSDAPAGKDVPIAKPFGHTPGALGGGDARKEAVAGIGRPHAAWALVA